MEKVEWNNVIYTAVVLDQTSQDALKMYLEKMVDEKPQDYRVFCHHMTVAFGNKLSDDLKDYIENNIGKEFSLIPIAYGESERAIAIEVETDALSTNNIKHITLCTMNGGKPVDSNNITNWREIKTNKPIQLNGTLKCILKQ